jgi:hypothetical protein
LPSTFSRGAGGSFSRRGSFSGRGSTLRATTLGSSGSSALNTVGAPAATWTRSSTGRRLGALTRTRYTPGATASDSGARPSATPSTLTSA